MRMDRNQKGYVFSPNYTHFRLCCIITRRIRPTSHILYAPEEGADRASSYSIINAVTACQSAVAWTMRQPDLASGMCDYERYGVLWN